MRILTIGFTKTSAERFFTRLKSAGVKSVVDVRLRNVSQLAGFAKRDDLKFFLKALGDIAYVHRPELAPTDAMLDEYQKQGHSWDDYERRFLELLAQRRIEHSISPATLDGACLLCSEDTPHRCHRRLVAEYLQRHWPNVEIAHL